VRILTDVVHRRQKAERKSDILHVTFIIQLFRNVEVAGIYVGSHATVYIASTREYTTYGPLLPIPTPAPQGHIISAFGTVATFLL
jgi:hypothetical protein